ncbi:MAG: DUF1801 domain-containing protein [Pseudomonadota bacterium]
MSDVRLLSGGNPQIAKGEGRAPVEAYIAAMPGWKRPIGEVLDRLALQAAPDVRCAVKWNQPLYGMDGKTWFFSFRCFTRYVKLTFFNGDALDPRPPIDSPQDTIRYARVEEGDMPDEPQVLRWLKQAARVPGMKL